MRITIPLSVEGETSPCLVELRDLSDSTVIAEIYRGVCEPGSHNIDFDTDALDGSLDAGVYILHVSIGGTTSTYPVQYMP